MKKVNVFRENCLNEMKETEKNSWETSLTCKKESGILFEVCLI